ncbi:DNA sulfur modification protein DndB [Cytobacillus sp. SAFR-174]|uniref:DNA sulfur modification protein DndB n=1 Tax=Cytobacillus sp. SAFR-174 TaxID=3436868 RepID=UPI003F7FD06F
MIVHDIFTKRQTFIALPVSELVKMHKEKKLILRDTNQLQVRRIKKYVFSNAAGGEIYMPPLVAAAEKGMLGGQTPGGLRIVDGSHRMKALLQLEDQIYMSMKSEKDEEIRNAYHLQYLLEKTEISIQVLEGLSINEENQLFIDLNTKGKQVALSKRIAYDSRDRLNGMTNRILQSNAKLIEAGVETEKRAIIRPANKKFLSLSQLRLLVATFLAGKLLNRSDEWKEDAGGEDEAYKDIVNSWFDKIFSYKSPKRIGNYHETMLASFPLIQAISIYAMKDWGNQSLSEKKQSLIERMDSLKEVNWGSTNPEWRRFEGVARGEIFYLDKSKRNIEKIAYWLETQRR